MAFTIKDMPDLTRILLDHPEWLAEVRRLVLTDELLNLPSLVRELAAIQQRGEQRMERLEVAVNELTTAQHRTEQKVGQLDQKVEHIDNTMKGVQGELRDVWRELRTVRGSDLEQKYARYAAGYFGNWIRRVQILHPEKIPPTLEDLLYDRLTHKEVLEVLRLDIILKGNLYPPVQRAEIYLAVEVSVTIELHDIERAQTRAALLRKAGLPAIPVVAGERIDEEADDFARNAPIVVVQNGRSRGWEEALAASQPTDSQIQ